MPMWQTNGDFTKSYSHRFAIIHPCRSRWAGGEAVSTGEPRRREGLLLWRHGIVEYRGKWGTNLLTSQHFVAPALCPERAHSHSLGLTYNLSYIRGNKSSTYFFWYMYQWGEWEGVWRHLTCGWWKSIMACILSLVCSHLISTIAIWIGYTYSHFKNDQN